MKKLFLVLLLLIVGAAGLALAFPDQLAESMIAAERERNGLTEKRITAAGLEWPYLEGGPDNAPVILMIHGFSADKDNWTRFAGLFTDRYRVIAPDLPGFGEQVRTEGEDYRLGKQIQRLQAFVAALGLEQFHLVGNSMGGHITAMYALVHPDQVLSAGLFNNAGIQSPEPSAMDRELAQGRNPLLVNSPEDFDRVLAYTMDVQPFLPWPVKPMKAREAAAAKDFNAYIFSQIKTDRGSALGAGFGQLSVPVLILWGENDRLLHVSATEVMKAALPSAEVVVLDDTGHLPMIERPQLTAEHYGRFIREAAEKAEGV